jgi:hypothetical protein
MKERHGKILEEERSLSSRTSGRSDIAHVGWRMFRDHATSLILAIAFLLTEFQTRGLWLLAASSIVIVRLWRRSTTAQRDSGGRRMEPAA